MDAHTQERILKWCQAEQNSFDQLKKCLANVKTLGYYDKMVRHKSSQTLVR